MAGDIKTYIYYDDYNKPYGVRLDATNAQQMGFVAAPPNSQNPPLPVGFKMRRGRFQTADGRWKRELPAPKNGAEKLKAGSTIQLPIYNEGSQTNGTFTLKGRTGERQTYS